MDTPRTFDVTLPNDMIVTIADAFEATQAGGVLTIAGIDNGTLAIFAPGAWKSVVWRDAKIETLYMTDDGAIPIRRTVS